MNVVKVKPNGGLVRNLLFAVILFLIGMQTKPGFQSVYIAGNAETGKIRIELPSDFPVFQFPNDNEAAIHAFKIEVENWKAKNPGFQHISFFPTQSQSHFEIPQKDFETFSEARKKIIQSVPAFYIVIPNKN